MSVILPVEGKDNQFVISTGADLSIITWDGEPTFSAIEKLATIDENPDNRLNDGKADRLGRIWIGIIFFIKELPNISF